MGIELIKALLKVQGAVNGVVKDAKNPHFKNRYATLEAVIDAVKPALQANGIVFMQQPGAIVNGAIEITTRLFHAESGDEIASTMHVPLAKIDPQGVGSAVTYGSRYSLMAILGLPPVDDDAEAAVGRPQSNQEPAHTLTPDESAIRRDFIVRSMDALEFATDFDEWREVNRDTIKTKCLPADQKLIISAWQARRHSFEQAEKQEKTAA